MMRDARLTAVIFLTWCSLVACQPTSQADDVNSQPQSAVTVKNTTQTLDLQPLGGATTWDKSTRTNHNNPLNAEVNRSVVDAFQYKKSHVWVEGAGQVIKILPDDNRGARHQKFLVRINAQQTLLFAHNIDLAPQIDALTVGDLVEFKGEYVFNPKGGVVHWTHRDPQSQQVGGWIKHHGHKYE